MIWYDLSSSKSLLLLTCLAGWFRLLMILLVATKQQKQDAIPFVLIIIYQLFSESNQSFFNILYCINLSILYYINLSIESSGNPRSQLCWNWDKGRDKQHFLFVEKLGELCFLFCTTLSHFQTAMSVFVGSEQNNLNWCLLVTVSLFIFEYLFFFVSNSFCLNNRRRQSVTVDKF